MPEEERIERRLERIERMLERLRLAERSAELVREFGKAIPSVFSIAKLPYMLIFLAGAFIFLLLFGGLTLTYFIQTLLNPFVLAAALIVVGIFRPKSWQTIIIWSLLLALVFQGFEIYKEIAGLSFWIGIPIIKELVIWGYSFVKFIPWLFGFFVKSITFLTLIYFISFIYYQLVGL